MSDYLCRYGRSEPLPEPVGSYDELLDLYQHEGADDGRQADCGTEPWPDDVLCPDCGQAPVLWAEAAFVPGHRICPWCGSHWNLDRQRDEYGEAVGDRWVLRRARFYKGR
jgi:hypothetical protein